MLLSADWFTGQWYLFGMKSNLAIQEAMKRKCRTIVSEIIDGEPDYWSASFEDGRVAHTYRSFFSAATDCKLHASDVDFLRQIADQTSTEINESDTITLLKSITELLVSDSSPEVAKNLSENTSEIVISTYAATSIVDVDFVAISLDSNTSWDLQLRNMTYGLPEYLADFATEICERRQHFVKFWARLVNRISEDERQNLLQWYNDTALELTQRSLEFPQWL